MPSLRSCCAVLALAACSRQEPAPPEVPAGTATAPRPSLVEQLAAIAEQSRHDNPYLGDARAVRLRAELERAGANARWQQSLDLGIAEVLLGREREGIAVLEAAERAVVSGRLAGGDDALRALRFHLAVACLRLGETENCCAEPTPDSCIVPLRDGGLHRNREGSERAIAYLRQVLEATPRDDYWHFACRWLLALAHMTLGDGPEAVAEADRIPASAWQPTEPFPRLRNIAAAVGVDTFNLSGSVVADDFDGDDRIDLLVSTFDTSGQLRYHHREADGSFADHTAQAGLTGLFGGLNMVQADYDNDGDVDVFVLRGAWWFEHGRHPRSLLRNDGKARFTDVTVAAGLDDARWPTQTAAWSDLDLDGDLDLVVGNEHSKDVPAPCQLYRNNGDGTFTDVAAAAGLHNAAFCKAVAIGDYDGDRDPDVYLSNLGSPNRLYRNDGNLRFTDVARQLGVIEPIQSFPCWFFDYDNDGHLDLYVSSYITGIGHIAAYQLGQPLHNQEHCRLYRNDGRGGFVESATAVGLTYPAMPMGCNFADVDADGWTDLYLGTGDPQFYSLMPNLLFRNLGGERFADVTMAAGVGHLQKGHGVAFADFDRDGDLDLFEQMGGAYPGDRYHAALFEHPGHGNRWLGVELVGTASNRSAIGAQISCEFVEQGRARTVHTWVNSGASFGCNPLRQTLGLGRAERIRRVTVFWPRTGLRQVVDDVRPDRIIEIVEGKPGHRVLELPPLPFVKR